jgi:hypothetical protein
MLAVRRSRTGSMRVMDAKVAAGIRARLSLFGTGSAARESFASEAGFIASGKIAAPPQQCAATDQTPAIGTKPAGWREGTWHSEPVGARPRARRLANSLVFDERLRAVLRYCGGRSLVGSGRESENIQCGGQRDFRAGGAPPSLADLHGLANRYR